MSELKIGDVVKVIGPTECGSTNYTHQVFQINTKQSNGNCSGQGFPYYPASSLRKVRVIDVEEGLKIGDWVEVIGPTAYYKKTDKIGYKFPLKRMDTDTSNVIEGNYVYPTSSLRKLSPDEIPCKTELATEYIPSCDWCNKDLGKYAIPGENQERYCSAVCSIMAKDHKRLDAIEKWQREHDHSFCSKKTQLFAAGGP